MVLSPVQYPPALRKIGVHSCVIHEVLYEYCQTTQVGSFWCDHLEGGVTKEEDEEGEEEDDEEEEEEEEEMDQYMYIYKYTCGIYNFAKIF